MRQVKVHVYRRLRSRQARYHRPLVLDVNTAPVERPVCTTILGESRERSDRSLADDHRADVSASHRLLGGDLNLPAILV